MQAVVQCIFHLPRKLLHISLASCNRVSNEFLRYTKDSMRRLKIKIMFRPYLTKITA